MPKVYGSVRRTERLGILARKSVVHDQQSLLGPSQATFVVPATSPKQSSLDAFVLRPSALCNTEVEVEAGPGRVKATAKPAPVFLQTHLSGRPLLKSCTVCSMSYVQGGAQDEMAHKRHHRGVVSGVSWDDGRGVLKRDAPSSITDVSDGVSLPRAIHGRVLCISARDGSAKLLEVLKIVDTVLSAPGLPAAILKHCKVFLFVTAHATTPARERVAGICVSQKIRWAMRVVQSRRGGEAVECDPTAVPASLGIHRLFTLPSMRRRGIANALLTAACQHTVYGREIYPESGEVSFSQPSRSGKAVMDGWGKGSVLVFLDDESQNDA